ncbi:MAG TPA: phosphoenolpyruvate carboxykinase (ATP) [candidate division Zixibacteria bacterium]|nr:phosphoenolpyruvate carboxykinase (ATP) [candidate division Zixibacteria bacterium]
MVFSSLHNKSAITSFRTIIETAFYRNNVVKINSVAEAYFLAEKSPGTIVTNIPVFKPEYHGLPSDAKILVFNDGAVVGRCAQARRIAFTPDVDEKTYGEILREAVYGTRFRTMYHAEAVIGLHPDFMVKAHLLVPEGFENTLLNWMLNFQWLSSEYAEMYAKSKPIEDFEIFVFADPYWSHPDFPLGLAFFDPEHNVAALLGLRYFGEFKKGTLTLGWGTANRHGYVACHGGIKRYDDYGKVFAFFGLSGSGKSTLTHNRHGGKFKITITHDDAFIIHLGDWSSIALEPAYFDKTADYKIGDPDNKYILTAQNVGVSVDDEGKMYLVTEDIRNGNGRAIKSRLWSPHRVDKMEDPINAVFWLMKDPALPPIIKIEDPVLASTMGTTLATKRTSAERVVGQSLDKLVVEPYANPFRTYPLKHDYEKFKELFYRGVECYILNTGYFMDKKVPKEVTLGILEKLVIGEAEFADFPKIKEFKYMPIEGFEIPDDPDYFNFLRERMKDRLQFVQSREEATKGFDTLPREAAEVLEKIIREL